jgi:hypothetical protein
LFSRLVDRFRQFGLGPVLTLVVNEESGRAAVMRRASEASAPVSFV